ncbi:hypothetical protein [Paenibacillus herberti]|uniref:Uncharacterized protein n=1 Tax=Paenibacillus herberti TaxID=1619309 RepID=A0A229NXP5_9BACL|nr:hypothetical protein [Paenibacillus herberti]OXM14670.1 hypothetical protein CGZ75_17315 [Paenibacillus herberti]
MTVVGMLIALFITLLSIVFLGPYGAAILPILLFGMVFSIYQKNKQIYEDVKLIREKLGLLREEEEIEREIQKSKDEYNKSDPEIKEIDFLERSEIDKEIEAELEKYINDSEIKEDKKE